MNHQALSTSFFLLFLVSTFVGFCPCSAFTPKPTPSSAKPMSIVKAMDITTNHKTVPTPTSPADFNEYWCDQRIHVLGNTGMTGALHAALSSASTKLIDVLAYNGEDVRKTVAQRLSAMVKKDNPKILDLCCGVGVSTRALARAFPKAQEVSGMDTSPEMIAMAKFLSDHLGSVESIARFVAPAHVDKMFKQSAPQIPLSFLEGNAEDTGFKEGSFDLVTIMYAFHEAPSVGRSKMLTEARRLLKPGGKLAVVDISSDYVPSTSMLAGEPYMIEYQQNIHGQMKGFGGLMLSKYKNIIPGRVGMWLLNKPTKPFVIV